MAFEPINNIQTIDSEEMRELFPTAYAEQERLKMVHTLRLFEIEVPNTEISMLIAKHAPYIRKHFPCNFYVTLKKNYASER